MTDLTLSRLWGLKGHSVLSDVDSHSRTVQVLLSDLGLRAVKIEGFCIPLRAFEQPSAQGNVGFCTDGPFIPSLIIAAMALSCTPNPDLNLKSPDFNSCKLKALKPLQAPEDAPA